MVICVSLEIFSPLKRACSELDTVGYINVMQVLCEKPRWFETKEVITKTKIIVFYNAWIVDEWSRVNLNKSGPCWTIKFSKISMLALQRSKSLE